MPIIEPKETELYSATESEFSTRKFWKKVGEKTGLSRDEIEGMFDSMPKRFFETDYLIQTIADVLDDENITLMQKVLGMAFIEGVRFQRTADGLEEVIKDKDIGELLESLVGELADGDGKVEERRPMPNSTETSDKDDDEDVPMYV